MVYKRDTVPYKLPTDIDDSRPCLTSGRHICPTSGGDIDRPAKLIYCTCREYLNNNNRYIQLDCADAIGDFKLGAMLRSKGMCSFRATYGSDRRINH
jgi:hypothetical protein